MAYEWQRGPYTISTDQQRIDLRTVHHFLTTSYWAQGISSEIVRRAIEHSLVFGLYLEDQQIGMARVVTDYTTFAYVADVFVLEAFRGQGLSKWLMEMVVNYPHLQGLRRWILLTKDAHGLYRQFGFNAPAFPDRYMERHFPNVYLQESLDSDQA